MIFNDKNILEEIKILKDRIDDIANQMKSLESNLEKILTENVHKKTKDISPSSTGKKYFKKELSEYKDAAKSALDRATTPGEIDRIEKMYKLKTRLLYFFSHEMRHNKNNKLISEQIENAVTALHKASTPAEITRIEGFYKTKVRAMKSISNL